MSNLNKQYRTEEVNSFAEAIYRLIGAVDNLDERLSFYMNEYLGVCHDVVNLAEALGHRRHVSYLAKELVPTALLRQCIEEVRQLTGKPKAALEGEKKIE